LTIKLTQRVSALFRAEILENLATRSLAIFCRAIHQRMCIRAHQARNTQITRTSSPFHIALLEQTCGIASRKL